MTQFNVRRVYLPLAMIGFILIAVFVLNSLPLIAQEPDRTVDIVGGQEADPGEWPHQVLLFPGNSLCGGSLIDELWVLTAAHCVVDNADNPIAAGSISVRLGKHNAYVNEPSQQIKSVSQVLVHENYNDITSFNNDIALLKLTSPATLNDRVKIIPLITDADAALTMPGDIATVTGWGNLNAQPGSDAFPDNLQEVEVPIISNDVCDNIYAITDNMICAGLEQGGKDACQGDSGGPLIVPDGEGGWKQTGVVSFGSGCAQPERYGVYTRVSQYINWMESKGVDFTPPAVVEPVKLTITKTGPSIAEYDEEISYIIKVSNSSTISSATNLIITDTVPTGATFVGPMPGVGGTVLLPGDGGTVQFSLGEVLSWTIPTLAPEAMISVQFSVTATETITNSDYGVVADDGISAFGKDAVVTNVFETVTRMHLPLVVK